MHIQKDPFFVEVKEKFKYADLVAKNSKYTDIFNFIFQVLCDALGTETDAVKIRGESKSVDVVIPKLLKLKPEEILYVAETDNITNPESYVLTMLYGVVGRPIPKKSKPSYDLNASLVKNDLFVE